MVRLGYATETHRTRTARYSPGAWNYGTRPVLVPHSLVPGTYDYRTGTVRCRANETGAPPRQCMPPPSRTVLFMNNCRKYNNTAKGAPLEKVLRYLPAAVLPAGRASHAVPDASWESRRKHEPWPCRRGAPGLPNPLPLRGGAPSIRYLSPRMRAPVYGVQGALLKAAGGEEGVVARACRDGAVPDGPEGVPDVRPVLSVRGGKVPVLRVAAQGQAEAGVGAFDGKEEGAWPVGGYAQSCRGRAGEGRPGGAGSRRAHTRGASRGARRAAGSSGTRGSAARAAG